jgi:hypothetical protein
MGEGRRGWARSRIIRPQESLGLYRSFNTLCAYPRHPTLLSPGAHFHPLHPAVIPHLPSPTTLYGFSKLIYCLYVYVETKIFSPGRITSAANDTVQCTVRQTSLNKIILRCRQRGCRRVQHRVKFTSSLTHAYRLKHTPAYPHRAIY